MATSSLKLLAALGLVGIGIVNAAAPTSTTTVVVQTTTTTIVQPKNLATPVPNRTNVCTTTHTQWVNWKAAPTPPADFRMTCTDGPASLGHEIAYIPHSALSGQSLKTVNYHWNEPSYNNLYWCCETCLGSSDCAMYQFTKSGDLPVCTHYIVTQGSGTKSVGYCPAGVFEVDEAPAVQHKPRNETGTDWEQLYNGGLLPGPCYAAGRVSSWECEDGKWAGPGSDFVIDL